MQVPVEIAYRNVFKTEELESLIAGEVARLERVYDRITSCRLSVERPNQHLDNGSVYRVRIEVRVPSGKDIVVKSEPGQGDLHDSLATVVQDVFDRARRALRKEVALMRREMKRHPEQEPQAVVARIFPEDGYGFLLAPDAREIYFHRNAVLNGDFDRLEEGTAVRYVERQGEQGPQASTVKVVQGPSTRLRPSA